MTITPLDASTVILMRAGSQENDSGFEVLLVRRSSKSAFVPSAYVFPGGKVEPDDRLPEMANCCRKNDLIKSMSFLDGAPSAQSALGILTAAIRETFEEAGILLAWQENGTFVSVDESLEGQLLSYRTDLNRGNLKFLDLLKKENLFLAVDRLHYFSRWITPELSPLRFDARFFIAEVPEGQKAFHDGGEVTKHIWITPAQALQRYSQRKIYMVAPTVVTLEELSRFQTINEAIESTANKNIKAVLTRLIVENNEAQEHTPDGRIFRDFEPAD
ncbi:MAG: NUDIX hydrolase [Syntrophaceae bacterium]|nr:NUDIX hydrolase [Syntrophaceae bacterium]